MLGVADQRVPETQGLGVTRLQSDHPAARSLTEGRIDFELGVGRLVEGVDLAGGELRVRGLLTHVNEVLEQHAELSAPVAEMICPYHRVAE